MSDFIVSARKYRPTNFDSVVGQSSITSTLKNAIKSNQLAQSFLFCGPRGVGKTTCARIFAKEINQFDNDNDIDDFSFNIFELDARSCKFSNNTMYTLIYHGLFVDPEKGPVLLNYGIDECRFTKPVLEYLEVWRCSYLCPYSPSMVSQRF